MAAFIYPPDPIFKSIGERHVFEAIKPLLSDGDALFANLQLSDPREGDIEIDLVLLLKDYGAMIIEVKGAHITYDNGTWMILAIGKFGSLTSTTLLCGNATNHSERNGPCDHFEVM